MTTALITGGAGFIGSHVAERFLAEGWTTHVVDNLVSGKREHVAAGATFHELDILDAAAADLVRALRPTVIVHLAAQMDVRKSVADPVRDAHSNVMGSLNLLEAVRRHSPRTRVVSASTGGAIYGDLAPLPHVEASLTNPDSPYGIAKLAVEHYLGYYGRVHGLVSTSLRYGNVYGPRQDPEGEAGVVAIFCGRILDHRPITIVGDGLQTRDYVYVSDVVDATWRAVTRQTPQAGPLDARAFNVGTGIPTSMLQLASALMETAGVQVPIEHAPARAGEQRTSVLDVQKAKALLDWSPQVALDDGLRRTFEWFAEPHATTMAGAGVARA